jgi:hypothetical protein
VCSANCAGSSGMKLFPGGRRFWRAASGAKQHVSLDGNKSSSRTCILIQERTRKENPGGKGREREKEGEEKEGEEKERDQSQSGRSFADNCSMIHQLIGHSNGECSIQCSIQGPFKPIQAHPRPTLRSCKARSEKARVSWSVI